MLRPGRSAALAAAVLLGLAGTACAGRSDGEARRTLRAADEREPAPPLRGLTLTGDTLDVADLRGRVVVLNVWGSWCAPCKKEQPDLVRVADAAADDGVAFVGINVKDTRENALAHNRRYDVRYPSLYDEGMRLVARFDELPPSAIPSTVLLDRRGRVAGTLLGATSYDELVVLVDRLAAESA